MKKHFIFLSRFPDKTLRPNKTIIKLFSKICRRLKTVGPRHSCINLTHSGRKYIGILPDVLQWAIELCTYKIGHYNLSVEITCLVSHTTHVVCVNFIREWRDLQFNVDSEWQIMYVCIENLGCSLKYICI